MKKLETPDKLTILALVVIVVCLYAKETEQKKGKVSHGMQITQSATELGSPAASTSSAVGPAPYVGTNTEHCVKWRLREVRFPLP